MSVPLPESSYSPPLGDTPSITQDDKTMAMLSYILGIFTGFVGPLVLWILKKDQSKFVGFHALQALLLHAVVVVGYILSSLLVFAFVGFLTYPAFFVLGLAFSIIAGLAANRGEWYDIPVIGQFARQQTGV